MKEAYLLLANGQIFQGYSFGAEGSVIGEVVFTTGMVGYQETLTDPNYYGQIVVQTFPLIGNYGVNTDDVESNRAWTKGYIVREYCDMPSNFRCENTIDEYLKKENIIGLYDIDTRALTRSIRENGIMVGMITTEDVYNQKDELLKQIAEYEIKDAVESVTIQEIQEFTTENASFNVVVVDYGYKRSLIEKLHGIGANATVVPALTNVEDILALQPDGILLSNGPGNPLKNEKAIQNIQALLKSNIPVLGIGLGHQLLALAQGAEVYPLKYGHHGSNQPVKDIAFDRVYVTSQNHSYAVNEKTLPAHCKVSHYNLNDQSCEGLVYENAHAISVQFYPNASTGTDDKMNIFNQFADMMKGAK